MSQAIHAVFKNGVFRPVEKARLTENQEVKIVIHEDSETEGIAHVAESSHAFEYLSDEQEDIYCITDGELIEQRDSPWRYCIGSLPFHRFIRQEGQACSRYFFKK